jgi:cystathionine beta-lyase/cystathionine gamma-synthase
LAIASGRKLVLIGPAYVDTGKIATEWARDIPALDCEWLSEDVSASDLEAVFEKGPALVLAEVPTNPRLTVPNLPAIAAAARGRDVRLALDATVATPFNFSGLSLGFDLVMHSTSKFLSGRYDHLGGVVSAASSTTLEELDDIRQAVGLGMNPSQMAVLGRELDDFPGRMARINANAEEVAHRLTESPYVDTVFYPGLGSRSEEALAAELFSPGRSGLVSFILKDRHMKALEAFYDAVSLPIKKGPGFGGETSLLCPYVLLAHYHDDDIFLKQRRLDRNLLRLSVGTEAVDEIWAALNLAS